MKKHSISTRIARFFSLTAAMLLLLTYPAPYINPQAWALPAVWGLTYPFWLAANVLFALYFLVRKKPLLAIIPIAAIACGWQLLTNSVAFNLFSAASPEIVAAVANQPEIKVLDYNVKNFDLYNWQGNLDSRNKMMDLIKAENADVLCFQEFYTEAAGGEFQNLEMLAEKLGYKHHYFAKSLELQNEHLSQWGLAIFSRHPITNTGRVNFEGAKHNMLIFADLNVNNTTVRVFNAHLQSIHLGNDDMDYVRSLSEGSKQGEKNKSWGDHLKSSVTIMHKLKAAYAKRSEQARLVVGQMEISPHPFILCGDFNDTPASYAYRTIAQHARDAFLENGLGFGGTYVGPLPSFRIDYMMSGDGVASSGFKVVREPYSDHYPISCYFRIGQAVKRQNGQGARNSPVARLGE